MRVGGGDLDRRLSRIDVGALRLDLRRLIVVVLNGLIALLGQRLETLRRDLRELQVGLGLRQLGFGL